MALNSLSAPQSTIRSYTEMHRRQAPPEMARRASIVPEEMTDHTSNHSLDQTHDKNGVFNPDHTIGYNQIVNILKKSYNFDETTISTSLDILALYLKGQKIIYTESKTYCEKHLNRLMLPAILIAAVCSILNFILKDYPYGTIIISAFNAFNSFILSIINYLKLAEKSQNHLMAAQRFHNLESRIELESGRSMFFQNSVVVQKTLEDIEKEIKEIQASNQFIVPEAIRYRYPKIYSANIFSEVKRIKNEEIIVINDLKTAVQDIHKYRKELDDLELRRSELVHLIDEMKGQQYDMDIEAEQLEYKLQEHPVTIKILEENRVKLNETFNALNEEIAIEYQVGMNVPDLPDNLFQPNDTEEQIEKKKEGWFASRKKALLNERFRKTQEIEQIKTDLNNIALETITLKSNKVSVSIRKKQNSKIIESTQDELVSIEKQISETQSEFDKADKAKNEVFQRVVKERERYIDLNREMNREIDKHIDKTRESCRCNPCDFFNT